MSAVVDSGTMHRTAESTRATHRLAPGSTVVKWITTTDHKVIGNLYLVTSFIFFLLGGAMLAWGSARSWPRAGSADRRQPRAVQPAVHDARHDHAVALRDTALRGLRQRDHAAADRCAGCLLPARQHALAYWFYLFGGLVVISGFLTPGGAAAFGWFAYAPLSTGAYSPGWAVTCGSSAWR
jgi:cytochrome c oxidase subunit 1